MKPRITYWSNGNIKSEEWYVEGELHRIDKPAITRWYIDGNIQEESWYIDGVNITSIINRLGFINPLTKEQIMQLRRIV